MPNTEETNLSNYEKNERRLCTKLFELIPTIKSYEFSSGRVCWDTQIILENDKKILGEVKVRDFAIDKYNSYILQVDKLVSLIKKYKAFNSDMLYYINFFKNNNNPAMPSFIIFDLIPRINKWKTVKPIVELKWMNAETCRSNTHKIQKSVIMLTYDPELDMKGFLPSN